MTPKKKQIITQVELKRLLHYDPITGFFTRRVRTANRTKVGDVAGWLTKKGYIRMEINGKKYLAHRLVWLYVHGYLPENEIDHKNQIKNDNRISNLRESTQGCNRRNIGNQNNNTSGVKGVCWYRAKGKWVVQIDINKKHKNIGRFSDFADAVCMRLATEQCLGWEKSEANSPAYLWVRENVQKPY